MSIELTSADQARLGLSGLAPAREEQASWPDADVARGREAAPPVSLESLVERDFAGAAFQPMESDAARRAGLEIAAIVGVSRFLRIRRPDEPEIAVRASRDDPGAVVRDRYDPGTAFVDPFRTGPVAAHTTAPLHLLFDATEGGLAMTLFESRATAPAEPLDSPLEAWCRECGDAWLRGELEARLEAGDEWSHTVGVGLYARLLEEPLADRRRPSLRELLDDPRIRAPREWGRDLPAAWRAELEERALSKARSLRHSLEQLREAPEPESEDWDRALLAACHARDDLESVWTLLVQAGGGARIEAALAGIDWQGAQLLAQTEPTPVLADERLRRVNAGIPRAWWARVASGTEALATG